VPITKGGDYTALVKVTSKSTRDLEQIGVDLGYSYGPVADVKAKFQKTMEHLKRIHHRIKKSFGSARLECFQEPTSTR